MTQSLRLHAVILFFVMANYLVSAQQNVVNVTTQIIPPYSPYLSTYVDQANKVNVILSNTSNAELNIKLWVSVVGDNNVSVTTVPGFSPSQPITLAAYQTKVIDFSQSELHNYFDVQNVKLTGITKAQLIQNQALPEGNYQVCIKAFDFATGTHQYSMDGTGCANLPVFYIDPPMLTQPTCNSEVTQSTPQNIIFSWTPPATAPGNIQYEFTLKEVPNTLNPNDVTRNNAFPVFYSTTLTGQNMMIYTNALPALEPGKRYAWRIKCIDPSNTVQFKNNGYSDVCAFNYLPAVQTFDRGATPYPITLLSPVDGSEIQWVTGGANGYGHYEFTWQNVNEPRAGYQYHTKLVKINNGQTAEDAIAKNPDMNMTDKGDPSSAPYQYTSKLDAGKYAWQVSTVSYDPSKIKQSPIWAFTSVATDQTDISDFTICGYDIIVTQLTNKDIDNLSGQGYVYLWDKAKVDVSFNGLTVRNCGITGGKKSDWTVAKGFVGADIKNLSLDLKPKDMEGEFTLNFKSVSFTAAMNAQFDKTKGYYIIQQGDKGEGCKRRIFSQLTWTTPFTTSGVNQVKGFNGMAGGEIPFTAAINLDLGSQDLIMMDQKLSISGGANTNRGGKYEVSGVPQATQYPFYGNFTLDKDIAISPDYPKNTNITFAKGSSFYVNGTDVTGKLNGQFAMWNGNFLGTFGKLYDQFNFSNANTLLLPLTTDQPHMYEVWNKDGSILSDLVGQPAYAVLGNKPAPGADANAKGLVFPDFRVDYKFKDNSTGYCTFKNATNNGLGYNINADGKISGTSKLNGFKTNLTAANINISGSHMYSMDIKGNVQIPFFNAQLPLTASWDYNGSIGQQVKTDGIESTAFDNGADKITAKLYGGTITGSTFSCDPSFSFFNNQGKNVQAKDMFTTTLSVGADGSASTKAFFASPLISQVAGTMNGFDYNVSCLTVTTENGKYKFEIAGSLVMEENTISTMTALPVTYSYNAVPYRLYDNNPVVADPSLTASLESFGTMEPVTAAAGDNSLEIKPGHVKAAYSSGTMDFEGEFDIYHGDATFGDGFSARFNVTMYQPMKGDMMTKIMVGKKTDYKYWYVEAVQENFVTLPTGIADLEIYGFGGRIYYNMVHAAGAKSIAENDYVPTKKGLGLYAMAKLRTGGSEGKEAWGLVATEIKFSGFTPYEIDLLGDAYFLSSGYNKTDGKLHGVATVQLDIKSPQKLHGVVTVDGDVYELFDIHGDVDLLIAPNDWHVYAGTFENPWNVKCKPIGEDIGGYFGFQKKDGQLKVFAGVNGTIFSYDPGDCMSLVLCDGCWGAHLGLAGRADAAIVFPAFQLDGSFSITGSASAWCTLCGVGPHPGISATFSGDFHIPSPVKLHGNLTIHTPSCFPNICVDATYDSGSLSFGDSCD